MSFRYMALCLLLGFIVLHLGMKNYDLWTQPIEGFLEEGRTRKGENKTEAVTLSGGPRETMSMAAPIMISEKNIFNPERKEFSVTIPDQSKPMMRPQIILYGVTIKEDYQSATIVNPGRPLQKGEREMMTLKIGEQVGEYRLAKILPDRIIMEAGEDSFEVLLYDTKLPKRRTSIRTETKPAEVTTTSPAPAPAPVPKAATAPKPVEPPKERVIEAPLPRPISPSSPSYPSILRGRRPVRPSTSPQSEGQ
jgi:hypothetical protein